MKSKFHSVELVRTKLVILRTGALALQARARGACDIICPSTPLFLAILYGYPATISYQVLILVQRCALGKGTAVGRGIHCT